jgi:hypothetical protein
MLPHSREERVLFHHLLDFSSFCPFTGLELERSSIRSYFSKLASRPAAHEFRPVQTHHRPFLARSIVAVVAASSLSALDPVPVARGLEAPLTLNSAAYLESFDSHCLFCPCYMHATHLCRVRPRESRTRNTAMYQKWQCIGIVKSKRFSPVGESVRQPKLLCPIFRYSARLTQRNLEIGRGF